MRTPAGAECAFYYEDMHRGREIQECRVARGSKSLPWAAADCDACPVPDILRANGSPDLALTLTVRKGLFGLGARRAAVTAWCAKHGTTVPDPALGCPACADEMLAGIDLDAEAPDV